MTTDDFISKLNVKIDQITKENKPLLLAVKSIMAIQSKRIFLDGKNAAEGIIGNYGTKSLYVNPKNSPKAFPTKGKEGSAIFKNGNPHKTGYFSNYLAFKTTIGRNKRVKTVDLLLTGELSQNWANAEALNKANAIRISQHHYIVSLREHNVVKVERYGNVFGLSVREKGQFLGVIQYELAKALK